MLLNDDITHYPNFILRSNLEESFNDDIEELIQ